MNMNGKIVLRASDTAQLPCCYMCGGSFARGQMVTPDGWRFYCLDDEPRY